MAEKPFEIHNRLAPQIVRLINSQCPECGDAFTVLESVCLGISVLHVGTDPRKVGEMLDAMTAAVIERMG